MLAAVGLDCCWQSFVIDRLGQDNKYRNHLSKHVMNTDHFCFRKPITKLSYIWQVLYLHQNNGPYVSGQLDFSQKLFYTGHKHTLTPSRPRGNIFEVIVPAVILRLRWNNNIK